MLQDIPYNVLFIPHFTDVPENLFVNDSAPSVPVWSPHSPVALLGLHWWVPEPGGVSLV